MMQIIRSFQSLSADPVLDFTEHDLKQNRIGQVSDTQKQHLQRKFITQTVFGIIFALVFALAGVLVLIDQQNYLCGIPILLVGVGVAYLMVSLGGIFARDLHVQKTTGFLEKEAYEGDSTTSYYFHVNDVSLHVSQKVYEAFSESGTAAYTFYYVQRATKNISEAAQPLSFEPADPDTIPHAKKKQA